MQIFFLLLILNATLDFESNMNVTSVKTKNKNLTKWEKFRRCIFCTSTDTIVENTNSEYNYDVSTVESTMKIDYKTSDLNMSEEKPIQNPCNSKNMNEDSTVISLDKNNTIESSNPSDKNVYINCMKFLSNKDINIEKRDKDLSNSAISSIKSNSITESKSDDNPDYLKSSILKEIDDYFTQTSSSEQITTEI